MKNSIDAMKSGRACRGSLYYSQVHGRNTVSWQGKFQMDVEYVDHITFLGDLKTIWDSVMVEFVKRDGISSETSVTMDESLGNEKATQ